MSALRPSRHGRAARRALLAFAAAAATLAAPAASADAAPFVYVTNALSGNVSQYDGAGGPLAPLVPPVVGGAPDLIGIAVSPDGSSVYVASSEPGSVLEYAIGAGGARWRCGRPSPCRMPCWRTSR